MKFACVAGSTEGASFDPVFLLLPSVYIETYPGEKEFCVGVVWGRWTAGFSVRW